MPRKRKADTPSAIIRPGRRKDLESLVRLLGQLFALEPDFAFDPQKQREGLRLMLTADSTRRVWVAVLGTRVAGMCTAQVVISTAEGGRAAVIEDVIVDRGYRRLGIGQALLAAVERWARRRGIRRLQLLADRQNFVALNFYSKHGWLPTRMVCLRRWVNGG